MSNEAASRSLAAIDVVILCGGLGTRLRPVVSDRPKSLAPVGRRPFLDLLVDDLVAQGFRRFVLCVGHLRQQIIEHYRSRSDAEFVFSVEEAPLGTGGAVRNAEPLVRSDPFVAMNGDSLCSVEFNKLRDFHFARKAAATFVLAEPEGRQDGSLVRVGGEGRILSFAERPGEERPDRYLSAGIYLLQKTIFGLDELATSSSLEHEVFPAMVAGVPCFGFVVDGPLLDIGTPQRLKRANEAAGAG